MNKPLSKNGEVVALNGSVAGGAGFNPLVSITDNATAQPSRTLRAQEIPNWLRTGSHRPLVAKIRKKFAKVLAETGDIKAAKKAIDADKKKLPGIMFGGVFRARGDDNLETYSQILNGDVDGLKAEQVGVVYDQIANDPHRLSVSVSPSSFGVKFGCPTTGNASQHKQSVAAMAKYFRETYGIELDPACKNVERLCFAPDNSSEWNHNAVPFDPLPVESKAERIKSQPACTSTRSQIAEKILGAIENDYCKCPGEHLHTSANGAKDCKVMLDGVPTIKCFHASCAGIVEGVNHALRSQIAKAEFVPTSTRADVASEYLGAQAEAEQPAAVELLEKLNARQYSQEKPPDEPTPRYYLGGVSVSTPGNLTAISSPVKTGKSAAVGGMIASTAAEPESDCLNWKSENQASLAVVHLDTEQAPFDSWQLIDRARRRGGLKTAPAWWRSYCVTGFSVREIRESIRLALDQSAQQFGGVHSLILDGVADCVADVNDPGESNDFVAELHALAIKYLCPVVGVIHLNPGSEKTRGHLGSQLERKAETNLRLEMDGNGITSIWSDKNRRAPIPKKTAPKFAWSDEHKMHVSTTGNEAAETENTAEQIHEAYRLADKTALHWSDLIAALQRVPGIKSQSTAERVYRKAKSLGIIKINLIKQWEMI